MCPVLCNFRQVSGSWEPKGICISGHLVNRCNGGGVRRGGAEEKSVGTLSSYVGSVRKWREVTFVSCVWVRSNKVMLSQGKFRLALGSGWL